MIVEDDWAYCVVDGLQGIIRKGPVSEHGGIHFHPPEATTTSTTTVRSSFTLDALHILWHDLIRAGNRSSLFDRIKPYASKDWPMVRTYEASRVLLKESWTGSGTR